MSDNTRLKSYAFRCPCCEEPHNRLYEYFTMGGEEIMEYEDISKMNHIKLFERVEMQNQNSFINSRSLKVDGGFYRCGKCYEFFKFESPTSMPVPVTPAEKEVALKNFKPAVMMKNAAVMNAVAALDTLLNSNGCYYDTHDDVLVVTDASGKEIKLDIVDQLCGAFLKDNPMIKVLTRDDWGAGKRAQTAQKE